MLDASAPAEPVAFVLHDAFDDCAHSRAVEAGPARGANPANSAKYSPPTTELAGAEPCRILATLQRAGLIRLGRKRIDILDASVCAESH